MKAAKCVAYGDLSDTVRIHEVDRPIPGPDEVLVSIRAASVNVSDLVMLLGRPLASRFMSGWTRPKPTVVGHDFAGVIAAVGANVSNFTEGQAVFGVCKGACAEFACVAKPHLAIKPENLTFEEAACLPVAGVTALQGLRDVGRLKAGDRVLVTGASSGVGTFAVQIAKALGAHVTAVCGTTSVDVVRTLGPDVVIDRHQQDYAASGDKYDLFFDLTADRSLAICRDRLAPDGRYVGAGALAIQDSVSRILSRVVSLAARSRLAGQPFAMFVAKINPTDLATLADLTAKGQLRSLIDRTYPLDRAGEAFAYLASRHAHGKVAITVPGITANSQVPSGTSTRVPAF